MREGGTQPRHRSARAGPAGRGARLAVLAPTLAGGIGRVVVHLTGEFIRHGLETDVLLSKPGGPFTAALHPRVNLFELPTSHSWTALPAMIRYLRRYRPDVILTESIRVTALALSARRLGTVPTRVYATVHNTYSKSLVNKGLRKQRSKLSQIRRHYPQCHGIIAVSRGVADDLARIADVSRERIHVIPNPVVSEELIVRSREPVPHPWFVSGNAPLIVAVGRLVPQKAFAELIAAFARVVRKRDCRLVILGDGPERAALEAMVAAEDLIETVDLPGFVDNPYSWIRRSALLVLSSRWEGFGNVLVEAMALGTPVVATDCHHGPREILRDGQFGALVPVDDVESLAEAIMSTLDDPLDANLLRCAASEYASDRIAQCYLQRCQLIEANAASAI